MEKESHKEDGMMAAKHEAGGAGDPAVDPIAKGMAAPHGAPPAGSGMGAPAPVAANPDHPDQQQDIDLFKQLIAQYLGPDQQDNDEAMKMCQGAYHEAMASGMPHEEAMKCAGYGMKMASLLGQKEAREAAQMQQAVGGEEPIPQVNAQDNSGGMPGTPGIAQGGITKTHPESIISAKATQAGFPPPAAKGAMGGGLPPPKAAQSHDASSDGQDQQHERMKQSNVIRLTAENAQLKEANRKLQVEMHLNRLLEGSGMSMKTTKAFRNIVAGMKTPAHIDAAWREFKEAFADTNGAGRVPFVYGVEKQSFESSSAGVALSFDDCIERTKI